MIDLAVKLGSLLKRPVHDQLYGDRDGFIIDPFGHGWTIASHVEDVAPDEMMRPMSEFEPNGQTTTRAEHRPDPIVVPERG